MWRPTFTLFKRIVIPSLKENLNISKILYSTKSRMPKSTLKLTLVSASLGILVGAGYGGYTHFKVNTKKSVPPMEKEEFPFLPEPPKYKPHYKVVNDGDTRDPKIVLFQYRTCPFCCKVRAYFDSKGISYEVVEVDAVLRQAIKWSGYKKVPIVLVKMGGGCQQLLDSTAIISIIETLRRDSSLQLRDIIRFYPTTKFRNDDGKGTSEIANKYFIMNSAPIPDGIRERDAEIIERHWRRWADRVLVHTLSPNVYRSPSEALETFKWFEQVGGWRQSFPWWECILMVYGGAAAMFFISKRLKKKHNIRDDVRRSLYDAANDWMRAVKEQGRFLGGDRPNLADVTVYGVLSSIEGCSAFKDLREHTDIGKWYDDIQKTIKKRSGKTVSLV